MSNGEGPHSLDLKEAQLTLINMLQT